MNKQRNVIVPGLFLALVVVGAAALLAAAPAVRQADDAAVPGKTRFDHDTAAPADADIVADFALDPFYERYWGTLSVVDGNRLKRSDGGKFDETYVGRKLCLKFADATRYPGIEVAGYYTIRAVVDEKTIELAVAPDVAVQNEAGYIFGDNDEKFRKLLNTAFASGKVYKVTVPKGSTFVLVGPFHIDNNKGGVHFVSTDTDDPYVGGATFKVMKEEDPTGYVSWFGWRRPTDVGPYDVVFENINLVARDSYGYNTEDNQALFRFAQNAGDRPAFTLKIVHCDFAHEYRRFRDASRAYLASRFKGDTEALHRMYYLAARPKLIHTHALGGAERPFTWHLEYVNSWYVRLWAVSNTLYNKSKAGEFRCVMRHVKAYGSIDHGRNGIMEDSPLKPLVDVTADADGDFTVMTLNKENEVVVDFLSLKSQYSNYSRKRSGYGIHIEIEGVSNPGEDVPSSERRNFIFINQAKSRGGGAPKLGTVRKAIDRGNGVFDVVLNPDPDVVDHFMGKASGAGERLGGVTQYDYICSDRNGSLTENKTGHEPTALIDRKTGYPNDYRGWVRYKYGDAAQPEYYDGSADWPQRHGNWIWVDNDKLAESVKVDDSLYMETGEHWNSTAVVQADGETVHYFGLPFGQAPNPKDKSLQIGGKYYEFQVVENFVRNLCGSVPVAFGERDRTFVTKHHSASERGKHGCILMLKGGEAAAGTYQVCSIWNSVVARKIVPEPGVGTRVLVDSGVFPLGAEVRVGHPSSTSVGRLLYAVNVRTGNRVEYPNGHAFVEGETLYAYYLGTGADNKGPAARLNPGRVILPKEWAVSGPVKGARLMVYTAPDASGGTHWVYGKGRGVKYTWEDVAFVDGKLGLIVRDGGTHKDGSVFKNCDLNYGPGLQLNGPITVDGGKYKVYGGGGQMTVKNTPALHGSLRGFENLDPEGTGWTKGVSTEAGK